MKSIGDGHGRWLPSSTEVKSTQTCEFACEKSLGFPGRWPPTSAEVKSTPASTSSLVVMNKEPAVHQSTQTVDSACEKLLGFPGRWVPASAEVKSTLSTEPSLPVLDMEPAGACCSLDTAGVSSLQSTGDAPLENAHDLIFSPKDSSSGSSCNLKGCLEVQSQQQHQLVGGKGISLNHIQCRDQQLRECDEDVALHHFLHILDDTDASDDHMHNIGLSFLHEFATDVWVLMQQQQQQIGDLGILAFLVCEVLKLVRDSVPGGGFRSFPPELYQSCVVLVVDKFKRWLLSAELSGSA